MKDDAVLESVERAIARRASKVEREKLYRTLNERLVLSSVREQEHAEAEATGHIAEAQQRAQLNALLTIETDDAPSYSVLGDPARLERVVGNLLTNALKYSPEDAPVNIRVARKGSEVELDVIDHGIGIEPESLKTLFDRYYRTRAGKEHASGLGLGLYIARLIVEAHGGRITVSSEVGKGSTFRVILPSRAGAS